MYDIFKNCIFDFSLDRDPGDYWYDCVILEASYILRKFDRDDWELLLKELKNKDDFWKKRLVECLGDLHVAYEFEVILSVINTSEEDLFISCIDALRLLDLSKLGRRDQEELLRRVLLLLDEASPPVKEILEEVARKLRG